MSEHQYNHPQDSLELSNEEIQKALARIKAQREKRKEYNQKRLSDPTVKEKMKEYREKALQDPEKRDHIIERRKAYYEKTKDKRKEYTKKYHEKNRQMMEKVKAAAKEAGMTVDEFLSAAVNQ